MADGAPAGVLGIADRLRPDAAATVTSLTVPHRHTAPLLLTGDNDRAAARLAADVGIDPRPGPDCCRSTR